MFNRRSLFALAAALPGAGLVFKVASSAKAASPAAKQRVAYHVSEVEKVEFVLSNIKNHIAGVGGPDNVEVVLVAHGPALKALHARDGRPQAIEALNGLLKQGVLFNACGNTLKAFKYELTDLPAGTIRVDQGGVVRLTELQQQGFAYLRP